MRRRIRLPAARVSGVRHDDRIDRLMASSREIAVVVGGAPGCPSMAWSSRDEMRRRGKALRDRRIRLQRASRSSSENANEVRPGGAALSRAARRISVAYAVPGPTE